MDTVDLGLRQVDLLVLALGSIFRVDEAAEFSLAQFADKDLDAGLVLVVPAAEAVVDAHDGFEIIEQLGFRHELVDQCREVRRAPLP